MRRIVQLAAGLLIAISALANAALPQAASPASQASPQPKAKAQPAASPGYRLVTLHDFSCGDFCYLDLTEAGQREPRTFICLAQLCSDWGEVDNQKLPAGLRMAKAEAQFVTASCKLDPDYDNYPVCTEVKEGAEAIIDLRLVKPAD